MKIKSDFVTNSSSTSFIFMFKGSDKWDLYRELIKHQDKFNLNFNYFGGPTVNIDVWKVIREIDSVLFHYKEDLWIKTKIIPITEYLNQYKISHEQTKQMLEESRKEKEVSSFMKWYEQDIADEKLRIEKVEELIEKGFTSVLHIGFGDNHGEIQGGDVGNTMDYEGRNIKVDDDNIVIFTEQNR